MSNKTELQEAGIVDTNSQDNLITKNPPLEIENIYNSLDFSYHDDINNIADFTNKLANSYSFASEVNALAETGKTDDEFYSGILQSLDNTEAVLVDPDIDPEIAGRSYDLFTQNQHRAISKSQDPRALYGLQDTFVDEYLKYNENMIVQDPEKPNRYAIIYKGEGDEEPKYSILWDTSVGGDGFFGGVKNLTRDLGLVIGGTVSRAAVGFVGNLAGLFYGAAAYQYNAFANNDLVPDELVSNPVFDWTKKIQEGFRVGNIETKDYQKELEQYRENNIAENVWEGFKNLFDSSYWIGGVGDDAIASLLELAAPAAILAKTVKVGRLAKYTSKIDDILANGNKTFAKIGDYIERAAIYGFTNTALESHMEGREMFKDSFSAYSELVEKGELTPDQAKAMATYDATESIMLNAGALVLSNMLEGAIYTTPLLNSPLRFLSGGSTAAAMGGRIVAGGMLEGSQELTQYGISKYIQNKYIGDRIKDNALAKYQGIRDAIAYGIQNDPEAMDSAIAGFALGSGMSILTNSKEFINDTHYKISNKDLIKAVHSELMSGQNLFKTIVDSKGRTKVIINKDAALSHNKFLNELQVNIDAVNKLLYTGQNFSETQDDIQILLTERMGMFIDNLARKNPDIVKGLIEENGKLNPKHPVVKVLSRELDFTKTDYRKLGFDEKIKYDDWVKMRDTAIIHAVNLYNEFSKTQFDLVEEGIKEDAVKKGVNTVLNQKLYQLRLGASISAMIAEKYDGREVNDKGEKIGEEYKDKAKYKKYKNLSDLYVKLGNKTLFTKANDIDKLAAEQAELIKESEKFEAEEAAKKYNSLLSKVKRNTGKLVKKVAMPVKTKIEGLTRKKTTETKEEEKKTPKATNPEPKIKSDEPAKKIVDKPPVKNEQADKIEDSPKPTVEGADVTTEGAKESNTGTNEVTIPEGFRIVEKDEILPIPPKGAEPYTTVTNYNNSGINITNAPTMAEDKAKKVKLQEIQAKQRKTRYDQRLNELFDEYKPESFDKTEVAIDINDHYKSIQSDINQDDILDSQTKNNLRSRIANDKLKLKDKFSELDEDKQALTQFYTFIPDDYQLSPEEAATKIAYSSAKNTKVVVNNEVNYVNNPDELYNEQFLFLLNDQIVNEGDDLELHEIGTIEDQTKIFDIPISTVGPDGRLIIDSSTPWVRTELQGGIKELFEKYDPTNKGYFTVWYLDQPITYKKEDFVNISVRHISTNQVVNLHLPTWFNFDNLHPSNVVNTINANLEFRRNLIDQGVGAKLKIKSILPGAYNLVRERVQGTDYVDLSEFPDLNLALATRENILMLNKEPKELDSEFVENVYPGGVFWIGQAAGSRQLIPTVRKTLDENTSNMVFSLIDYFLTGNKSPIVESIINDYPEIGKIGSRNAPNINAIEKFLQNYVNVTSNVGLVEWHNNTNKDNKATIITFLDAKGGLPKAVYVNGTYYSKAKPQDKSKYKRFGSGENFDNSHLIDNLNRLKYNVNKDLFTTPNSKITVYSDEGPIQHDYIDYIKTKLQSSVLPVKVGKQAYSATVNNIITLEPENAPNEKADQLGSKPLPRTEPAQPAVMSKPEVAPKGPASVTMDNLNTGQREFADDDLDFLYDEEAKKDNIPSNDDPGDIPSIDDFDSIEPTSLYQNSNLKINNDYYIPNVDAYFVNGLYNSIIGDIAGEITDLADGKIIGTTEKEIILKKVKEYHIDLVKRYRKIVEDVKDEIDSLEDKSEANIRNIKIKYARNTPLANIKYILNGDALNTTFLRNIDKMLSRLSDEPLDILEQGYDQSISEKENDIIENANTNQMNEDRVYMFNPNNKASARQKIFLSSIPTGSNTIFTDSKTLYKQYYDLDVINGQTYYVLARDNGRYYEPSYEKVRDIVLKSSHSWRKALIDKLDKKSKNFQNEFVKWKYLVNANFNQIVLDVKKRGTRKQKVSTKILSTNQRGIRKQVLNAAFNRVVTSDGILLNEENIILSESKREEFNTILSSQPTVDNIIKFTRFVGFNTDRKIMNEPIRIKKTRKGEEVITLYDHFKVNWSDLQKLYVTIPTYKDGIIPTDKLHSDSSFNILAKKIGETSDYIVPLMNLDGSLTTSNYISGSRFYDAIIKLQTNPESVLDVFSSTAEWIREGKNLKYQTTALQAIKSTNSRNQKPRLKNLSLPDVEHVAALYFFNSSMKYNSNLKKAYYLTSTYADKGKVNIIEAYRRRFNSQWDQDKTTRELLFSQIIEPEINRMIAVIDSNPDLATYKPFSFYFVPEINEIEDVVSIILNPNKSKESLSILKTNEILKEAMIDAAVGRLQTIIAETKLRWNEFGIGLNSDKATFTSIDDNVVDEYLRGTPRKAQDNIFANDMMVTDYVLNYSIAYANMHMTLFGDPAQYYKGSEENETLHNINSTTINVSKRLGKMSSPGDKASRTFPTINYGFIKDNKSLSPDYVNIIETVEKINYEKLANDKEIFPELDDLPAEEGLTNKQLIESLVLEYQMGNDAKKDYIKRKYLKYTTPYLRITPADAQEFVHWVHRLNVMFDEGEINAKEYNQFAEYILKGKKLPSDKKYKLLGARKPLYVGTISEPMGTGVLNQDYYIKSSDIPLLPSIVEGKPLGTILKAMNGDNNYTLGKKREDGRYDFPQPKIERLTFESAVKQGLPKDTQNIFGGKFANSGVNPELIKIKSLPSNFLANQLDVPYKDKSQVTASIQLRNTLTADIKNETIALDETLKNILGKDYAQIKEIDKVRDDKLKEWFKFKANKFISEITTIAGMNVDGNPVLELDLVKLKEVLSKEMKARGYDSNEQAMIDIIGVENKDIFILPIYMTANSQKFQSLIANLINSNTLNNFKRPGLGAVQASSLGFNTTNFIDTIPVGEKIIYTSSKFDGTLKYLSNDGVAQLILPWKYKVDIENFMKDGIIDPNKIPKELLRGIGYRIPNQGKSSTLPFEIVGFLPASMGDTVIVPTEIVAQMGSDFDVDKLYSYLPSIKVDFENPDLVRELREKIQEYWDAISEEDRKQFPELIEAKRRLDELRRTTSREEWLAEDVEFYENLQLRINSIKGIDATRKQLGAQLQEETKKLILRPKYDTESRIINELFDIEYNILKEAKNIVLRPLDNAADDLEKIIDEINKNKPFKSLSLIDVNYQRDKFLAGSASKAGVGAFSLLSTFISKVQNRNVSINNFAYVPLSINGVKVAQNLSHHLDEQSIELLESWYTNDLKNKYIVYDRANEEYKLVDAKELNIPEDKEAKLAELFSQLTVEYVPAEFFKDSNTRLLYDNVEGKIMLPNNINFRQSINIKSLFDKYKANTAEELYEAFIINFKNKALELNDEVDIPIIDTEDIINFEGQKGAAQYDRINNVIKVNRELLRQKFEEKAWTNPRTLIEIIHGEKIESKMTPLFEDAFTTYEDFEEFVIEHEYQHSLLSREQFDKDYKRENPYSDITIYGPDADNYYDVSRGDEGIIGEYLTSYEEALDVAKKHTKTNKEGVPTKGKYEDAINFYAKEAIKEGKSFIKQNSQENSTANSITDQDIAELIAVRDYLKNEYTQAETPVVNENDNYDIREDWSTKQNFINNASIENLDRFLPNRDTDRLVNKSYHAVGYQTIAVDNANKDKLNDGNLNTETFKAVMPLLTQGMDSRNIQLLIQQPIIKEYIDKVASANSIGKDYNPEAEEDAFRSLFLDRYSKAYPKADLKTAYRNYVTRKENMMTIVKKGMSQDYLAVTASELAQAKKEYTNLFTLDIDAKTPLPYMEEIDLLYAYREYINSHSAFTNIVNLFNRDSSGGGKSIREMGNVLGAFNSILEHPTYNVEGLFIDTPFGTQIDNFGEVIEYFKEANISVTNRADNIYDNLITELGYHLPDLQLDNNQFKKDEITAEIEKFISSYLWNKVISNRTNENADYLRYTLLRHNPHRLTFGQIISNLRANVYHDVYMSEDGETVNITKTSDRNFNLDTFINTNFFKRLEVQIESEFPDIQFVTINNTDNSNINPDTVHNEIAQYYNQPVSIGYINGKVYTTRDFIDDMTTYALVTGARQSTTSLFNLIPADILKSFSDEINAIDLSYKPSEKEISNYFMEFVLNNPGVLPTFPRANPQSAVEALPESLAKQSKFFKHFDDVYVRSGTKDGKTVLYKRQPRLKYKNLVRSYNVLEKDGLFSFLDGVTIDTVSELHSKPLGHVNVGEKIPRFKNSAEALAWVYMNSRSPVEMDMAQALMQDYGNIEFVFLNDAQMRARPAAGPGVIGYYGHSSQKVFINTDYINKRGDVNHIILHELGHAATLNSVYQYMKYRKTQGKSYRTNLAEETIDPIEVKLTSAQINILDRLYDTYESMYSYLDQNGFTELKRKSAVFEEFISEMLSDPILRSEVDKVGKTDSKFRSLVNNLYREILSLFKTIIDLFTSKPKGDLSYSDKVISSILFLSKTTTVAYKNKSTGDNYLFTLMDNNVLDAEVNRTINGELQTESLVNPSNAYSQITNSDQYEAIIPNTNVDQTSAFANPKGGFSNPVSSKLTDAEREILIEPIKKGNLVLANESYKKLGLALKNRLNRLLQIESALNTSIKNSLNKEEILANKAKLERVDKSIQQTSNDLHMLIEAQNLNDILNIGKLQADEIEQLLAIPDYILSPEQMLYISNIADIYDMYLNRKSTASIVDNEGYFRMDEASQNAYDAELDSLRSRFDRIAVKVTDNAKRYILDQVRNRKGANIYFNMDEILDDITAYGSYLMAIDRTNEDLMSMIGLMKEETIAKKDEIIAKRIREIDEALIKIGGKLSPKSSKYGHYTKFLNDDGTLVFDLSPAFHDQQNKLNNKVKDLEERKARGENVEAPLKRARREYANFRNEVYIDLNTRILYPRDTDSVTDAVRDNEIAKLKRQLGENMFNEKFKRLGQKIDKYNLDYEVYKSELEATYSVNGVISPDDQVEIDAKLHRFELMYSPYELEAYRDRVFTRGGGDGSIIIDGERIYPKYKYAENAVKRFNEDGTETGYYNPKMVEIRDDADLLEFHQLLVKTFREVRDTLPAHMKGSTSLADLPFFEKEFFVGMVSDLINNPMEKMRDAKLAFINQFLERIPSESEPVADNFVRSSFIRNNAASIYEMTRQRLIDHYGALGIIPSRMKYEDDYYDVKNNIQRQVAEELSSFKSYDLAKIAKLYFAAGMTYSAKESTIDDIALLKYKTDTKLTDTDTGFTKRKKGGVHQIGNNKQGSNKYGMLQSDYTAWQGFSPRNPFWMLSKNKFYNKLEKIQKKNLEDALTRLYSLPETDEVLSLINKYEQDLDKLGGRIYFGNIIRVLNSFSVFTILGYNIGSYLPNKAIGFFNNLVEAADGRAFTKPTFNKIAKEIYFKSELTQFATGVGGALIANILFPGSGWILAGAKLIGGYGLAGLAAQSLIKPSKTATKIIKLMVNQDLVQKSQEEAKLSTGKVLRRAKSSTGLNKLGGFGRAFSDFTQDAFIFTTKSEIPHQATLVASQLADSKFMLNGEETNLLDQLDDNGELMNADAIIDHPKIPNTKIKLDDYFKTILISGRKLIARNHGDYRQEFKQRIKYNDIGVLAATFKTWMFESYATRLEQEKKDLEIQSIDNTYLDVKGSYLSLLEKGGKRTALGAMATRTITRSTLTGLVASAFYGPIGPLVTLTLAGIGLTMGYKYITKNDINNQDSASKTEVGKLTLQTYLHKLAKVPKLAGLLPDSFADAQDRLNDILDPVDAANFRRVITERVIGTWLFSMYIALALAKELTDDDDDETRVAVDRMLYFSLNTIGRMALDIDAYSSPTDAYSKIERLDRVMPSINYAVNSAKLAKTFFSRERYERKTGRYEKGDLKANKYFRDVFPIIRAFEASQKLSDQEFKIYSQKS